MTVRKSERRFVYDNTLNKTRFNLITAAQKSVLFAILAEVQAKEERNDDGYLFANITYSRIRELTGSKNLATKDIIRMVDELLSTKLEYYTESRGDLYVVKEHIFNVASVNLRTKDMYIEVSRRMEEKMTIGRNKFTIIDVGELSSIKSHYGQELYRMLSQFRSTGKFKISVAQWREHFDIDDKVSDYYIMRKQIIPAFIWNQNFFENLTVNIKEGDIRPPSTIFFHFKSQRKLPNKAHLVEHHL